MSDIAFRPYTVRAQRRLVLRFPGYRQGQLLILRGADRSLG